MGLLGYEGFIALRYLRARRKQTLISLISLISVLGITVGVAALVIALALMTGFHEELGRRIVGGNAQLTVFSRDLGPGGRGEVPDPDLLVSALTDLPEVAAAAPFITGFGVLSAGGEVFEFSQVQGVDPVLTGQVLTLNSGEEGETITEGPPACFADLAAPTRTGRDPILLGWDLAGKLGVPRGELVKMFVHRVRLSPWAPLPRQHHFEVVGTFRSGFADFDAHRTYIPLATARRLFGMPEKVSWVSARLAEGVAPARARREVEAAAGPDHVVVDILEQNREFFAALRLEKLLMFLAIGLIVAVAGLSIVSTLLLMVMEKVRDIGALMAMGATPRGIVQVFLFQGITVGLLGSAAGALLGTTTCWALTRWRLIRLDPDLYYIDHLSFLVRPLDLVVVILVSFTVCLLATLYPSWKASRLDPVEALRYE